MLHRRLQRHPSIYYASLTDWKNDVTTGGWGEGHKPHPVDPNKLPVQVQHQENFNEMLRYPLFNGYPSHLTPDQRKGAVNIPTFLKSLSADVQQFKIDGTFKDGVVTYFKPNLNDRILAGIFFYKVRDDKAAHRDISTYTYLGTEPPSGAEIESGHVLVKVLIAKVFTKGNTAHNTAATEGAVEKFCTAASNPSSPKLSLHGDSCFP